MKIFNNLKLKTELIELKTRLMANEAYESVYNRLSKLKDKLDSNEADEETKESKESYKQQMSEIMDKLKEKSADALADLERLISDVEKKLR